MYFGRIGPWVALLKEELKKKRCQRCALRYDHKKNDKCPDCGDLDSAGLARLVNKKEREYQGRKSLGNWFFVMAIIIIGLLMLVSLNE